MTADKGPIERLISIAEFPIFQRELLSLLESERETFRRSAEKAASEGNTSAANAAIVMAAAIATLIPKINLLPRDLVARERGVPVVALGAEPGYRGV